MLPVSYSLDNGQWTVDSWTVSYSLDNGLACNAQWNSRKLSRTATAGIESVLLTMVRLYAW